MIAKLHPIALVMFALLLGLFDGPAQIAAAFALLTTVGSGQLHGWRIDWIDLGILVWVTAGLLGAIGGEASFTAEQTLRPLLALVYLLGRTALPGADSVTLGRIAFAFALASVINGAYGWLQVLVIDPPIEMWIIGRRRVAGLVNPDDPGRLMMASGLFYNGLKLAHVDVVALALIGVVALDRDRSDRRRLLRDLAGGVILWGALLLSLRRAAPVALFIATLAVGLTLRWRRLVLTSLVAAAISGTAYVAWEPALPRIERTQSAIEERWAMVRTAMAMIADHPWLGVGHGQYSSAIAPYAPAAAGAVKDGRLVRSNAHNLYLQVLADTGIVGLAGLMLAVALAFRRLAHRTIARKGSRGPEAIRDRFVLIALLTLLLIGCGHALLYHAPVAMIFWALLGLAAGQPLAGLFRKARSVG